MKRIREEGEVLEQLNKHFKETKNSTMENLQLFKYQNYDFISNINQELISSIQENKKNIFKFICKEFPKLISPLIFWEVTKMELEMMKFLFEKKIISKETRNSLGEDLLMHWTIQSNFELVEYLIKVQHFDLTTKSSFRSYTGNKNWILEIF
jgi:hypothetical protein